MATKDTLKAVVPTLAKIGFRKRAGHVFTIDVTPEVVGWLGLNTATKYRGPGEVEVNPVVGVRFQNVERLVAECRGAKFHDYQPPTIGSPLGYVMPEKAHSAWMFAPGRSEEAASDMVDAIATYGVPFIRSLCDLVELRRYLEDRYGFDHQLAYRRPAAALLAGDTEGARRQLDRELVALGTRNDPAAENYRNFAESFRRRLPTHLSR